MMRSLASLLIIVWSSGCATMSVLSSMEDERPDPQTARFTRARLAVDEQGELRCALDFVHGLHEKAAVGDVEWFLLNPEAPLIPVVLVRGTLELSTFSQDVMASGTDGVLGGFGYDSEAHEAAKSRALIEVEGETGLFRLRVSLPPIAGRPRTPYARVPGGRRLWAGRETYELEESQRVIEHPVGEPRDWEDRVTAAALSTVIPVAVALDVAASPFYIAVIGSFMVAWR